MCQRYDILNDFVISFLCQFAHLINVCSFLQGDFPTPCSFGENLRTPLRSQGLLLLVLFVSHFSEGGFQVVRKYISPANV